MLQNNQAHANAHQTSARGFHTLFAKILAFVGVPVILSYVIVGVLITNLVGGTVTQLTSNELAAESQSAANEIEGFFLRHYEIANQIALISQMEQMVTDVVPGMRLGDHPSYAAIDRTMELAQEANSDSVLSIWVGDVDSSQYAQMDGAVSADNYVMSERAWFANFMANKKTIMTAPYEDSVSKQQIVTVMAPIISSKNGEILGMVGVDFSLEGLEQTISTYTLRNTGYYILTTGDGLIIYHPDTENIGKNINDVDVSKSLQDAIAAKTVGNLEYSSQGVESHGYLTTVGDTGWMVATGLPNDEFNQANKDITLTMMITFVIAAAVLLVIILILSRVIAAPIKSLTHTANLIAQGNLNVTSDVNSQDETGLMAVALNGTVVQLRQYTSYINEITQALQQMARGDMRVHLKEDYVGEFASIRAAFDEITTSLNRSLRSIHNTAEQVSLGADQVASGAQSLASGSTEQAATVQELNASISMVADQASENLSNVKIATEQVGIATERLEVGTKHMDQLSAAMVDIGDSSKQVANITKVIEDIAFQTNILALNAAVEAARAGSAGKGFAVVADEVRNLAAKSAEAAKQTTELIRVSVDNVERGTHYAAQTAQLLQGVAESSRKVKETIAHVDDSSVRQAAAIEEIKMGLNQVSAVVQTNAATAEENSATSEEMSAQAATMRMEVGKFQLESMDQERRAKSSVKSYKSDMPMVAESSSYDTYELGKY